MARSAVAQRVAIVALLVALFVAFGAWITHSVATDQTLDFNVYYLAAEAYARGDDPYALSDAFPSPGWDALAADLGITHFAKPYRYPPQTAVLVLALRPLGPVMAAVVWDCLNAAAMILGALLLGRVLGGGWWTPVSLAALLLFGPAYDTLRMGQVNGLLFASLTAGLWWLQQGRDAAAGVGIAVGGVLKLVPIVLVPYLMLRRRWRLAAAWLLATLAFTLLSIPFTGWEGIGAYAAHAVMLTRPNSVFTGVMNQTLSGVLGRAFGDAGVVRELARVCGIGLLAVTAVFCRPRGDAARWLALEYSVVVVVLGLVFPFTWYHQLVVLLIPLLVVAQELLRQRRWALLVVLGGLYAATSLFLVVWLRAPPSGFLGARSVMAAPPFLLGLFLWVVGGALLVSGKGAGGGGGEEARCAGGDPRDASA